MPNILEMVKYNADGLVPAVTQDIRTDEVLMLAYMNEESLIKTIETGKAHYYSRSRQKLWLKGETSGHFQKVRSISVDCDGDTLLLKVEQTGAACHTGHRSCFFTRLEADELKAATGAQDKAATAQGIAADVGIDVQDRAADAQDITVGVQGRAVNAQGIAADVGMNAQDIAANAQGIETAVESSIAYEQDKATAGAQGSTAGPEVLGEVFGVITDRLVHPKEGSYTNYLFTKGLDKILKKIGEEASEVMIASKNGDSGEISSEIADLLYHVMVLLADRRMSLNDVYEQLYHRK